ncbi:MAG: oxidoreductase [Bryobacteraceae bacterium]|jgi:predicted dehydrogenase
MNSSSRPIRVALIGYGFSGKTFHAPLIAAVAGFELRAIASRDAAKVHADLPDITVDPDPLAIATSDEIDLVVIATPNQSHAPIALAALAAGKHVIVDKPFALNLTEARELIALSEHQKVLLSVFHNRRWDSDFLTVRRAIGDRLVGTVTHFESHIDRFRPQVRDRWRERSGPGSGLWFDLGPHLVDQALQLFGLPDRVQGNLAQQRTGALSDDWAHVVLDYHERRVILHAASLIAGGTHRFTIHGDEGSLVKGKADRQERQLLDGTRPGDAGWGEDADALLVYDRSGASRSVPAIAGDQRLYYKGILDALSGNARNPVTPIQALAVMAVIQAAVESAHARTSVEVAMTPEERAEWA